MYAVVETGGKQYRVAKDDVVIVERLAGKAGDTVSLDRVLMVGEPGGTATVGAPLVDKASVTAEIIEQGRADKIIVFKKQRRKNYRRTRGHRQDTTVLKVTGVNGPGGSSAKAPVKKAAAESKAEAEAPAQQAAAEPKATAEE
ncbi:MAG: 50S ribosomal protein L21 [Rhodospirillales bacterium]